jgi:thiol-disulfide isomerase/thioredoxin
MSRFYFIAACLFTLLGSSANAEETPSAAPFFALSMNTIEELPVALASFKGKPLVVNFWARWCGPCRKEIPDLAEMHEKYKGKGLVTIGIAVEDATHRDSVREFAKAYDMNYTLLIGGIQKSVELMKASGNPKSGLPFTLVIDRQGKIVSQKLGAMSKAEMEAAIKPIL